jgi:hypothetical protein
VENWFPEILTVYVWLTVLFLRMLGASAHLIRGTASNSGKIIVMDNINSYGKRNNSTIRQTDRKQSHTFRSYRCHIDSEEMLYGWRKEQMGNPYLTA